MSRFIGLFLLLASFAGQPINVAASVNSNPQSSTQDRSLHLDGAPNFRDIGGRTVDGHQVRWARVFRSSALSRLTPADATIVDALHIVSVIDLRAEEERKQSPSVWTHVPTDLYESPKPTLAPVMQAILRDAQTAQGVHSSMIDFYRHVPEDYRSEYSAMFHRIAAGELPLLVHCTDRTITVTNCGRICIGKRKINLSTVFAGQNVGVKEVSDKIWLVSFMKYDLGFFDQDLGTVTSAENPFGAKVLPMCSV
jgi:hypothetical protein